MKSSSVFIFMLLIICDFDVILTNHTRISIARVTLDDPKYIKEYVERYILYSDILRNYDFTKNLVKKKQIESNLKALKNKLMKFSNESTKNSNMLSTILDQVLQDNLDKKYKTTTKQNKLIKDKINALSGFWG